MAKYFSVENRPDLIKDVETGSIYISNDIETRRYELQKKVKQTNRDLRSEVDQIKNDIDDIKSMLSILINK